MRSSFLTKFLIVAAVVFVTPGCSKIYYNMMEEVAGVHKRDILVDRVKDARVSQEKAKEQFQSALDQFKATVAVKGGDLEAKYNKLNSEFTRSQERAEDVRKRIAAIEDVSKALFKEWEGELGQYSNPDLRRRSEKKLDETKGRYDQLMVKMEKAESRMDPVLNVLRDQTLYLKHNLNAAAIGSLDDEVSTLETNVNSLIKDMEASIADANKFIDEINAEKK